MTVSLGKYSYTYGAGREPNREINFQRDGDEPKSIKAVISAQFNGRWSVISELCGSKINVEMMSTTDKMQALLARRKGIDYTRKPDISIAELPGEKQEEILNSLEPKGHWRIAITNGFGGNPRFEKVEQLSLFNPA